MNRAIKDIIDTLQLEPHPEGGFYKRVFVSDKTVTSEAGQTRQAMTGIYYLLSGTDFSTFHRLDSDETWHYYAGNTALHIHAIDLNGKHTLHKLDAQTYNYTHVVPAHHWFGSHCAEQSGDNYVLVGCNVAPGFEFQYFEMAECEELLKTYPQHSEIIQSLTRL